MNSQFIYLLKISLTAFLLMLSTACTDTPDEEQIAENLNIIITSAQEKKMSEAWPLIHDGFVANNRNNKDELKKMAFMMAKRYQNINVTVVTKSTTINANAPTRATTEMEILLSGGQGYLPSDGKLLTATVKWVKDGDWLVYRANWE